MPNIIETNDSRYEEDVIKSNTPVLVLFKSEWCPSCKKMTPVIDKLSDEYKDRIKFVRVDVTRNIKISEQNNVLAIPTLLFIKNGKETTRIIGDMSESELRTKVDKNL